MADRVTYKELRNLSNTDMETALVRQLRERRLSWAGLGAHTGTVPHTLALTQSGHGPAQARGHSQSPTVAGGSGAAAAALIGAESGGHRRRPAPARRSPPGTASVAHAYMRPMHGAYGGQIERERGTKLCLALVICKIVFSDDQYL